MINIRTLDLQEDGGFTLKNGKKIVYKTGYQVATEGKETTDKRTAMNIIKEFSGNCGVWFSKGIYYIDKSHRVSTKKEALRIGKECNQLSILKWTDTSLIWV